MCKLACLLFVIFGVHILDAQFHDPNYKYRQNSYTNAPVALPTTPPPVSTTRQFKPQSICGKHEKLACGYTGKSNMYRCAKVRDKKNGLKGFYSVDNLKPVCGQDGNLICGFTGFSNMYRCAERRSTTTTTRPTGAHDIFKNFPFFKLLTPNVYANPQ